jgi:CPA2 family monovalent cation:H+ antiporter-2
MLLNAGIPSIIYDVSIIFGLAVLVLLVCSRLKVPTVLGFLLTGVIAGPDALGLTQNKENISIFAEIGIVFLLFTIGIEFSLKDLVRIKRQVFLGGFIQLLGTVSVFALLFFGFSIPFRESLMLGLLFAFSSTAIVLKVLHELGKINTEQGRSAMAVLVFQDIAVIPLMLLLPGLTQGESGVSLHILQLIFKAGITVVLVLYITRSVMPKLLYAVARSKSQELFLMTVLVICLSVAWLTAKMGLSLSLGAFLAGLIISESEYSHEAFSTILPFREVFTSFFFISIGLLVDMHFFAANAIFILAVTILIVALKALISGLAVFATQRNIRTALLSGLYIAQVGEFSFVLAGIAAEFKLISGDNYQLFLSISVLSMGLTPFVIERADLLVSKALSLLSRYVKNIDSKRMVPDQPSGNFKLNLSDHAVVIGFNEKGKVLSKIMRMAKIPFVAIDIDPEALIQAKRRNGESVIYGNARKPEILKYAGVPSARLVVLTLHDTAEIESVIAAVRGINERCHILAFAPAAGDFFKLYDAGANELVSEKFENAVEMGIRLLQKFQVSGKEIEEQVGRLRQLNYAMERSIRYEQQGIPDVNLELPGMELVSVLVKPGSATIDSSIETIEQRFDRKLRVLAIRRVADVVTNPESTWVVKQGDRLIVFASREMIDALNQQ